MKAVSYTHLDVYKRQLLSRCGRGEKGPVAVPVNVMSLTRQPIKEKLSVSGPISGTDSVDVVSNIHAEIITMNVKEGDKVTKDQILAVLDKTDLERDLQVAQNAYDLAVVKDVYKRQRGGGLPGF